MSMFGGLTLVTAPALEPVSLADARAHSRVAISPDDDSLLSGYIASARAKCEMITKRAFMPQTWRYAMKHFPGRAYDTIQQLSDLRDYYRWNHFEVPLPPLVSIVSFTYTDTQGNVFNMAQGYDSAAGNYLLDLDSEPGCIVLPYSGLWPTTILLPGNPILLTYRCGYLSFSGTADLSAQGVLTQTAGDQFTNIPSGSWLTYNGASYDVQSVTDATHLQLQISSVPTVVSGKSFSANAVPMSIRHAILLLAGSFYENRESVMVSEGRATLAEVPRTVDDLLADYVARSKRR